jgi:hypothetical protein
MLSRLNPAPTSIPLLIRFRTGDCAQAPAPAKLSKVSSIHVCFLIV